MFVKQVSGASLIFFILLPNPTLSVTSPSLFSTASSSSQCSVCPNPRDIITLPNASIPIFGTCGALDATIGFFPNNSDTCRLIQSVSSLCGCPVSKSSCFLCNHNYDGPINASRPVPYLLDVPGINVTCDIVQAYLHSISYDNSTCTLTKSIVAPYCGCPSSNGGTSSTVTTTSNGAAAKPCSLCKSGETAAWPDKTIDSGLNLPFLKTCGDLENVAQTYWNNDSDTCTAVQSLGAYCGCAATTNTLPCTFCSDRSPVTLVNKTLPFLKQEFNLAGLDPTCGLVDAALQSISLTDPICTNVRLFGSYCGCPAIPDHCKYCPKPTDQVTKPDFVVGQFGQVTGLKNATCEEIMWTQFQVPSSSDTCWKTQSKNFLCGCNNGQFNYLGADNIAKKRVLAWLPRVSALLSVCGTLFILVNIYRYHTAPLDQYHELVASLAVFNLLGSLATTFTTLPIPTVDQYGQPNGIYGAHGTVATCKAQGFFVHLGYTGIYYNLALSVYYVLVVNYGFRESDLKRVRMWFHLPALVGFAFAFAAIPYIDNFVWLCHVPGPPFASSFRYIDAIVLIPITVSMIASALGMVFVYFKVLRQTRTSNKWRFGKGGGAGGKLARKVFWQAFFFVVALYGSWPILVVAVFTSDKRQTFQLYWFWVLALTLAPLQGFFNFFVYVRPQIMKFLKRNKKKRREEDSPQRPANWARLGIRLSFVASNITTPNQITRFPDKDASRPATKVTLEGESGKEDVE